MKYNSPVSTTVLTSAAGIVLLGSFVSPAVTPMVSKPT